MKPEYPIEVSEVQGEMISLAFDLLASLVRTGELHMNDISVNAHNILRDNVPSDSHEYTHGMVAFIETGSLFGLKPHDFGVRTHPKIDLRPVNPVLRPVCPNCGASVTKFQGAPHTYGDPCGSCGESITEYKLVP